METAQWVQGGDDTSSHQVQERKVRPQNERALNCPRCKSTNTKFCYYNNYSLTQPRYFCKSCRRYWTQGGSLRNVPVGGGSRKNKRPVSSATSSSFMPKPVNPTQFSSQNFNNQKGQDLNLGFQATPEEYHHGFSQFVKLPKVENSNTNQINFLSSSFSTSSTLTSVSALDLLRTGISSGGLNAINTANMSDSSATFNRMGFNFQEFKPTMTFPFDGHGIKYGSFQQDQEDGGRTMLPFGVLNQQLSSTRVSGQNMEQGNSAGYWNGTLGEGSC